MKTVLQRVRLARVSINGKVVGEIGNGLCALVAVTQGDGLDDVLMTAEKISRLRIFNDDAGKFNLSLMDTGGGILAVSNFTVAGDTRKGRRPSFSAAAKPEEALVLFDKLISVLRETGLTVETGVFGAHMDVEMINDGPVTVIVDTMLTRRNNEIQRNPENSKPELKKLLGEYPQLIFEMAIENPPDFDSLSHEERNLLKSSAEKINGGEELKSVLDSVLMSENPSSGLYWLQKCGIFSAVVPELDEMVYLSNEDDRRHKHVWDHTVQVVSQTPKKLELRWAALFHDIGKVPTRKFEENGKVTFYGHDSVGARLFSRISKKLGLETDFANNVRYLIRNHLRPGQYGPDWTDSAVRRFDKELRTDLLTDLLELGRADITSKRPGKREDAVAQINELERRIMEIREQDAIVSPLPGGLGNAIMEAYNITPGPILGVIRRTLEQDVASGKIEGHQDASYYVEKLFELYPDYRELKK